MMFPSLHPELKQNLLYTHIRSNLAIPRDTDSLKTSFLIPG